MLALERKSSSCSGSKRSWRAVVAECRKVGVATPLTNRMAKARSFTRPLPLAAVFVLIVNDHVLKGASFLPQWITGKLSDVAGLFFFPILLTCVVERCVGPRRRARVPMAAVVATGLVFSLLKLSPAANEWANRVWGEVVRDPSDLLALPSLYAAYMYMRRAATRETGCMSEPRSRTPQGLLERAILLVAATASLATSRPARPFATWHVGEHSGRVGCADLEVWVAKSGKQGVGISVRARAGSESCQVRLEGARLSVDGNTFAPVDLPKGPLDRQTAYLPFLFDNERLWNEGKRSGTLELDVVAGGEHVRLALPMMHLWDDANRHDSPVESPNPAPPSDAIEPVSPVSPVSPHALDGGASVEVSF